MSATTSYYDSSEYGEILDLEAFADELGGDYTDHDEPLEPEEGDYTLMMDLNG
jgi:hypothetical protein